MKLRNLATTLREEPLAPLIGEAGWRAIRSLRKSTFQLADNGAACPVSFHPVGYYRLQKQLLPDRYRDAIIAYADAILRGEYPLIGYGRPNLGLTPDWHCDWVSGKDWPLEPSAKIQIVRHDGSDVKAPWELSRLQFCPVVAKAHVLTGDRRYRAALQSLLADWIARNPVGRGVNWTSAMEAALRAISLCLTMDLLAPFTDEEKPWIDQMTTSLWQHLRFIEAHSEFSFRLRSNHYLSNIAGLTTLSAFLHGPGMQRRLVKYARAVQQELLLQTYADGGDCEASTGYHVLVAQLCLHSLVVQQRSGCAIAPEFEARLRLMFEWVAALADDTWKLPHLGDCDNGRVELLYSDIVQTGLAPGQRNSMRVGSLCGLASDLLRLPWSGDEEDAAWFGCTRRAVPASKRETNPVSLMPDSGIAVLRSPQASLVFCAMPNGIRGKGSHTHCDKLSIVFRLGADEVFCDTGSQCYSRSVELRNHARSTKAHNTLVIDEADQNILPMEPGLIFQCGNEASVSRIEKLDSGENAAQASHRGYFRLGIAHQRTVQLGERCLLVMDDVSWDDGSRNSKHALDLRFILGPEWQVSPATMDGETVSCVITGPRRLTLACQAQSRMTLSVLPTEISREYGAALAAHCILIHTTACLPATLRTRVRWD